MVITTFLVRWSGVGALESHLKKTKPGYVGYVASTSAFLPLPKRGANGRGQVGRLG